jgi:DNA-binding beta-propeller fold protein YncE
MICDARVQTQGAFVSVSRNILPPGVLAVLLPLGLLVGCAGDSSSPIADIDTAKDEILESSRPDASVGLTLALPKYAGRPTTFSLLDDADGAFSIDSTSGVVLLAGAVDYETATEEIIVAEAIVALPGHSLKFEQRFRIAVLDSPPPAIEITFPFAHARYSDPIISVSGRVDHPQIENVGISAQAGADAINAEIAEGRFSVADVSIAGSGQFTLTVTASHPGGDTAVETMTLSREPELTDVPKMVLDPSRNRILLVDRYSASIVATPLDGAARVIVSGKHVGTGPALIAPVALAIDTQGDALYVIDDELRALLRVDLVTGDRTLVSDQSRGTGPLLWAPTEMDFDSIRGSVIVSDENQGVLVVDPATGDRRLLSSATSPGPQIYFHRGIGFDTARDRYLVSDSVSLFSVNPVTGSRTMLSDWQTDPSFGRFFRGMSVASESGAVFLGEEMSDGVLRIDLSSGQRQAVTSSGLPAPWNFPVIGAGPPLQYPNDVVFDAAHNRLFVIEGEYADPLMEVSSNGDRTVLRDGSLGTGVNFRGPSGIKYDTTRRSLLAADYVADLAVEIDLASGNRALIRGPAGGRGSIYEDPIDVAFNPATGLFYVVDFQTSSLYSIDPGTGARTIIADATTGTGPLLGRPQRIEIDPEHAIAYLLDPYGGVVTAVDLASGARRTLTGAFGSPTGMTSDFEHQRLFLSDGTGAIYSVDVASGASERVAPGSSFSYLAAITHDSMTNSIVAIDEYPARLYSIDLGTGVRSMVSGQINFVETRGRGPGLIWPRGVAVDAERQVAFVTDDAYDAVIAVDLLTGDRQLIAK